MLSFITLNRNDWKRYSYVTLDGVSEHAMLRQLELNLHLKSIVLCLDHDEAGIEATGRLKDILSERGYADITVKQSQYKDWNEDLKAKNNVSPIEAQEHPKLALLPEITDALHDLFRALSSQKGLDAFLIECSEAVTLFLTSSKAAAENAGAVQECLQCMAGGSLVLMQRQLHQMERPVSIDQLIERLQESYRPHEDRGWLRTKAEELRQDIANITRQAKAPGIRTLEDKEKLLSSYQRLALDSVKALLFIELDMPKMLQTQEQSSNFIMAM